MSLPVSQYRPDRPASAPDRAGVANPAMPDKTRHEPRHPLPRQREQQIDEELAASFPASDPPSWVHGAEPAPE